MSINFHIQTLTGRMEDKKEPSTATDIDIENCTQRELNQFYLHLKSSIRNIERMIDEDLTDENE